MNTMQTNHSQKKVAVVLSGCGFLDGAEITEAVSTLIALSETGASVSCFAPNEDFTSVAHTNKAEGEKRNVLVEAARIARGHIHDLRDLKESKFDAVIFPGGFGAAKYLTTWASDGAKAKVHPEAARVVKEFHRAAKPIGAICIAPTLIAKVLGSEGVNLTIGSDEATAREIEKTGAHHVKCAVTDYVSDRDHKVITTPAYMCEAQPFEIFTGIRKLVREIVEMA
jgi:enhancing lycopene biosynthesis protein 2